MGAVLCCSSRRVGGVVPVEPVLGDLRPRGQDQDAAVRGPAARRESLRGPRAAGQALQYCELPRSVLPSPSAPSSFPPRECQEMAPAKSQGPCSRHGAVLLQGMVDTPMGTRDSPWACGCCDMGVPS